MSEEFAVSAAKLIVQSLAWCRVRLDQSQEMRQGSDQKNTEEERAG
jgi:hypothetical protein